MCATARIRSSISTTAPRATKPSCARSRALTGPVDLLLTQFSYAAWKGGRANAHFREVRRDKSSKPSRRRSARSNRATSCRSRASSTSPTRRIPTSTITSTIRPMPRRRSRRPAPSRLILFPGDAGTRARRTTTPKALARLLTKSTTRSPLLPLRPPGESVPLERLEQEFAAYRERVFRQNSQALIRLLRRLPCSAHSIRSTIRLTDLGTTVSVSIVDGFTASPPAPKTSRCTRARSPSCSTIRSASKP